MKFYQEIRFVNEKQKKYLLQEHVLQKKEMLKKLDKNNLILNILINDYLKETQQEIESKRNKEISKKEIRNNNQNQKRNNYKKETHQKRNNYKETQKRNNEISKPKKYNFNILNNDIKEIQTGNQEINKNINSKNKYFNTNIYRYLD